MTDMYIKDENVNVELNVEIAYFILHFCFKNGMFCDSVIGDRVLPHSNISLMTFSKIKFTLRHLE